jgi:hypothetical protein
MHNIRSIKVAGNAFYIRNSWERRKMRNINNGYLHIITGRELKTKIYYIIKIK